MLADVRPPWAPRYAQLSFRSANCVDVLLAALCFTTAELQEAIYSFFLSLLDATPTSCEMLSMRGMQSTLLRLIVNKYAHKDEKLNEWQQRIMNMLMEILIKLMKTSTSRRVIYEFVTSIQPSISKNVATK